MVASKDGTKVPLNIIRRKGTKLDGTNPVLLTGYGGYGLSMTPGFSTRRRLWLDAGGVWAVANLRGGAEFGSTTLSRFYAIHMLLLPGAIIALIGAHLYLVVKQGTTAPPWLRADPKPKSLREEQL